MAAMATATKTCELLFYDAQREGRPVWGSGPKRSVIIGFTDGWVSCNVKAHGSLSVHGQQRELCEEHLRQVRLLDRHFPETLDQLRWKNPTRNL
jgi:hypothetical protein